MSLLALLPLAAFLVGAVAVGLAVARALDEVQQLKLEIEHLRRVRPLVAEVGTEALRLRLAAARMRRH